MFYLRYHGYRLFFPLLAMLVWVIVASIVLHRRGVGDLRVALRFGAVGAIGGVAGAAVALALPGGALRVVFAAFLALVGARLVRDGIREQGGIPIEFPVHPIQETGKRPTAAVDRNLMEA